MPATPFSARGYTKYRNNPQGEQNDMTIEAQSQMHLGGRERPKINLIVRVGVAAKPGGRPLDDLTEHSITLTYAQALAFAASILTELSRCQSGLDEYSDGPQDPSA